MTKRDQRRIVIELCNVLKKDMLTKLTDGKVPVEWDGIELRQWFADRAKSDFQYHLMSAKRRRAYNNDLLVRNL